MARSFRKNFEIVNSTKKFKIGDKVQVLECTGDTLKHIGKTGLIQYIGSNIDNWVVFKDGEVCIASNVIPVVIKVGRPKKEKESNQILNSTDTWNWQKYAYSKKLEKEVTFEIIKLEDGTEFIFLPQKDWSFESNGGSFSIYRRIKK